MTRDTGACVAIYCRISEDKAGRSEGVEAQESWGREYAAQQWPDVPIEVFADNDISAAKDDVTRPEFERLRAAVRAGEIAHLWTVEQSRLTRREPEWFGFVSELVKVGITEIHTRRNGVVRTNEVVGSIMAVLDAYEVRKLRQRILDRMDTLAEEGRPGGGPPFGYRAGVDAEGRKTREIVPEQAEIIRDAADRALAGWSLTSIAEDLHARGVRGAHGGKVKPATVRQWLTNASTAGKRMHRGKIVGKASWEPILDESTWQAIRAVWGTVDGSKYLDGDVEPGADQVSVRTPNGGTQKVNRRAMSQGNKTKRRVYLLTGGVAVCGLCDTPLAAAQRGPREGGPRYSCMSSRGGCGKIALAASKLEGHVASRLLDHLDEPEFRAALLSDEHAGRRDEILTQLQALDGQRVELGQMWQSRELSSQQFTAMNRSLVTEEQQLQNELASIPPPPDRSLDPEQLRAAWPYMILDEQRQLVSDWIERVTVHSGKKTVTLRTVAERAGLAETTVGFVLRSLGPNPTETTVRVANGFSESTRRRVREAAAELGYKGGFNKLPVADRVKVKWKGGSDTA